jgi:predicted TPR repeat methyltransferase
MRGSRDEEGTGDARFGKSYYDRFYESPKTRVHGAAEIAHLGMGILGFARWFGVPVTSVLEVGAGTGLLRDWFVAQAPGVHYRSVEVSEYACEKYRHEQKDIRRWRSDETYDLVICQGVLPYLPQAEAAAALANLASMTGAFLYLEAVTDKDLREVCDNDRTDLTMYGHSARFYRDILKMAFRELGLGLFAKRDAEIPFYELEAKK